LVHEIEPVASRGDEVGDLARAFSNLATNLQSSVRNLIETETERERMEGELNAAHEMQMSMLPLLFPAFPDHTEFDVRARLKPAREVGGDFYDFFFVNEDELCFSVGDVSGKGVPAALFMAVTKSMIKTRASDDYSPASIVTRVNDALSADNPSSMFVTLWLGILNIKTSELRYTNAGHNPPYIKRQNGQLECMNKRHGPIIGAVEGVAFKEDRTRLSKGDLVLVFTDGVTEAMDTEDQLYSDERLVDFLNSRDFSSAEELVVNTLVSVEEYSVGAEQSDDITILSIGLSEDPVEVLP
jgi:sigma-B regulation protein RsbU (phosphoserine phosphatase)